MNEPHTPAKARGFVLDADGKILLVRHREDKPWTLPGGHIEPGETPHQAFVREILEETGLHIELTGSTVGLPAWLDELPTPIANYSVNYIGEDGSQVVKFEYIFSARITSWAWKLQAEEVVDFWWFSREEILTMDGGMLYPQIQTLLHKI